MAIRLHIRVLGPFEACVDGTAVPAGRWQRQQARLLVKLLALEPHHQLHREVLVERLWPDAWHASTSNNLNKVIHAARRALEPDLERGSDSRFIVTREHHVALGPPGGFTVDAIEFERLAMQALAGGDPEHFDRALTLYRGDLLEEDRYDDRMEARRERLRGLHRNLTTGLATLRERSGDAVGSLALLEQLVERDRLDEDATRRLMRMFARLGQRDRAIKLFAEFRARLREDVGADPEPATADLHERIRRGAEAAAKPYTTVTSRIQGVPRRETRFVGRERAVEEIANLVQSHRLVTLTGFGGIGKTRLAVEVRERVESAFPGGVWFAALDAVPSPELVAGAIIAAFGVPRHTGSQISELLALATGGQRALIVLDNCEHLLDEVGARAGALLAATGEVHLLATSRQPLGTDAEVIYRVTPLSLPPAGTVLAPAELADFEATLLFLDRLGPRKPGFSPSDRDTAMIQDICQRLDGVPLAIELAAAMAATLTLAQVHARLDDRLGFEPLTANEHRRTLRAVLDRSYELLGDRERRVLARLSVFSGGCSLEAAEAVCSGDEVTREDVFSSLARLADASLVDVRDTEEETRFTLLETVRLYAAGKLDDMGEAEAARERHARWLAGFAESVEQDLYGQNQRPAVVRLDRERENIWGAIRWSLVREDAETVSRLCGALWLWLQRTHIVEARAWFEAVVAMGDRVAPDWRARLLHGLGSFLHLQGDLDRAIAMLEEAVEIRRSLGDATWLARTLQTLSSIVSVRGEYDRSFALQRETLDLIATLDDPFFHAHANYLLGVHSVYVDDLEQARARLETALLLYRMLGGQGNEVATLHNLAFVAWLAGDHDRAEQLGYETLDASRRIGDVLIAPHAVRLLGDIALERGDAPGAEGLYRQAAASCRMHRDRLGQIRLAESMARLRVSEGRFDAAARLLATAARHRELLRTRQHPYEREMLAEPRARIREATGADPDASSGAPLPLDTVLELF